MRRASRPCLMARTSPAGQGEPGWWSVQDGAITGMSTAQKPLDHQSYLFCAVEGRAISCCGRTSASSARWETPASTSAVRNCRIGTLRCYQADMETGPNWTGGLYECNQRAIVSRRGQKVVIAEDGKREVSKLGDGAELLKLIKPHDWNQCEIIARGPEIVYKINGTAMSQVIDREKGKAAAAGVITLQFTPACP